jgi:murein tripeptide amidase MpaA
MSYYNSTEVESALIALSAAYPTLTSLITLPHATPEGRLSHALRIGSGNVDVQDAVLLIGGVHAREWGSCEICINFATDLLEAYTANTGLTFGGKSFSKAQVKAIVKRLQIIVFTLVNPDGRHYSQTVEPMWRKNRNPVGSGCVGVDINRNFDFLWDFPKLFSPAAHVSCSTNPCDSVYHGPAPFSEAETKNVRWLIDTYPKISWLIDIHSYGELILYSWGDDQNQTTDPKMNFSNPAYNSLRGIDKDTAYKEYIPAGDLDLVSKLALRVGNAIKAVRGKDYTSMQSFGLYPTSGTSDDYAYSRHCVDPSKSNIRSFTIEWGTDFQPPWGEMEKIILDITAGLVEFCLAATPTFFIKVPWVGPLAWAWLIIIGGLMLIPPGPVCIVCGPTLSKLFGSISILIGVAALVLSPEAPIRLSRPAAHATTPTQRS